MSVAKTSVASADKTSVVSHDIPMALRRRPQRGCASNGIGIFWETTDVMSADTTGVLAVDATDVLSADTTDLPPADTTDVLYDNKEDVLSSRVSSEKGTFLKAFSRICPDKGCGQNYAQNSTGGNYSKRATGCKLWLASSDKSSGEFGRGV